MSVPDDMDMALYRTRAVESTFSRNVPLSVYSFQSNHSTQGNSEFQELKTAIGQMA